MSKIKPFYCWLNNGQFYGSTFFSCGLSYDEIIKRLTRDKNQSWITAIRDDKDRFNDGSWGYGLYREIENIKTGKREFYTYIILTDFNFSDWDFIKLAHEVLHICQFYLPKFINLEREYESEAYFHSYLLEQCMKMLRVHKLK